MFFLPCQFLQKQSIYKTFFFFLQNRCDFKKESVYYKQSVNIKK